MTVNDLIKILKKYQKENGNAPVVLSSDTEGNSYGTTDRQTSHMPVCDSKDKLIGVCLFPFEEGFYEPEEAVEHDRR